MKSIKLKDGTVYQVDGGFVISDEGGWLDGVYDSVESAELGIMNRAKEDWAYLGRLRDSININENRNIGIEDFKDDQPRNYR